MRVGWLVPPVVLAAATTAGCASPARAETGGWPGRAGDSPAVAPGEPLELDLVTVVALAARRSRRLALAREAEAEAGHDLLAATSRFLPDATLGAEAIRHDGRTQGTGGEIVDAHKQRGLAGATLSLVVDPAGAAFATGAAASRLDARRAGTLGRERDVLLDAAFAFYDLVAAREVARLAARGVERAEEDLRRTRAMVEQGVALALDRLRHEAALANERQRLIEADLQESLARVALARALEMSPETPIAVRPGGVVPLDDDGGGDDGEPPAQDELLARARAARPELREAAADAEVADRDRLGTAVAPFLPRVRASTYGGTLGFGAGDLDDSSDYALAVEWDLRGLGLWDLGNAQRAASRSRQAAIIAEETRERVAAEVVAARQALVAARARTRAAEVGLQAAAAALERARDLRRAGRALAIDVLAAEQALGRAEVDRALASVARDRAVLLLRHATGATLAREEGTP